MVVPNNDWHTLTLTQTPNKKWDVILKCMGVSPRALMVVMLPEWNSVLSLVSCRIIKRCVYGPELCRCHAYCIVYAESIIIEACELVYILCGKDVLNKPYSYCIWVSKKTKLLKAFSPTPYRCSFVICVVFRHLKKNLAICPTYLSVNAAMYTMMVF